jgi:hypothetical protein
MSWSHCRGGRLSLRSLDLLKKYRINPIALKDCQNSLVSLKKYQNNPIPLKKLSRNNKTQLRSPIPRENYQNRTRPRSSMALKKCQNDRIRLRMPGLLQNCQNRTHLHHLLLLLPHLLLLPLFPPTHSTMKDMKLLLSLAPAVLENGLQCSPSKGK